MKDVKQCRIEYLYPTMDLNKVKHINWIKEYESLNLLPHEKFSLDTIQIVDLDDFSIPKLYEKNWQKENIERGAYVLANHPEYLPVYIGTTARIIINELLGVPQCYLSELTEIDTSISYYLKGKMHLSVFLSVIESLEKNGINLAELPVNYSQFVFVGTNNYIDLSDEKNIDSAIRDHIYCDSNSSCNYHTMKKYCNYKNLNDFLNNVKEMVSRVEMNAMMPNPEFLNFKEHKYFADEVFDSYLENSDNLSNAVLSQKQDIEALSKGDMISIISYIDKVLEELKAGETIAENRVAMNYIKKFKDRINSTITPQEKSDLAKGLKDLLNNIQLKETTREECNSILEKEGLEATLDYLYRLLDNDIKGSLQQESGDSENIDLNREHEKLAEEKSQEVEDSSSAIASDEKLQEELEALKKSLADKEYEIENLKKSVAASEQELEELKGIILEYLNNGVKNKKLLSNSIQNEEIRQFLKNYHSKNILSEIRKIILLATLTLSVMGNVFAIIGKNGDKDKEIVVKIESPESSSLDNISNDSSRGDSNDKTDDASKADSSDKVDDTSKADSSDNADDTSKADSSDNADDTSKADSSDKVDDASKADSSDNADDGLKADLNNIIGNVPLEENNPEIDNFSRNNSVDEYSSLIYIGKPIELQDAYYYQSIYDQEALGVITEVGFLSGYFPYIYTEDGISFYRSLRSEEAVLNFINEHIDIIDEIYWKAAFTRAMYMDDVEKLVENNQEVPYVYTTYFIDYEPNLKEDVKSPLRK